jgi:hypothetical protein
VEHASQEIGTPEPRNAPVFTLQESPVMSHDDLPYLASLRSVLVNLEPLASDDPMMVLQVSAAKRLIDFMEVQRGPARHLRLQACTSLAALLDDLGDVLPELGAVVELKTICASVDPDSFDRVLHLAGTAQRALLAVEDPRANRAVRGHRRHRGDIFWRDQGGAGRHHPTR